MHYILLTTQTKFMVTQSRDNTRMTAPFLMTFIRRSSSLICEGQNQSPCNQEEMNISVSIYQPLVLIRSINKVKSVYYDVSAAISVLTS